MVVLRAQAAAHCLRRSLSRSLGTVSWHFQEAAIGVIDTKVTMCLGKATKLSTSSLIPSRGWVITREDNSLPQKTVGQRQHVAGMRNTCVQEHRESLGNNQQGMLDRQGVRTMSSLVMKIESN